MMKKHDTYIIPAGTHRSRGRRFILPSYRFKFKFHPDCRIDVAHGWNILAGWSNGWDSLQYSIRIAWRYDKEQDIILLASYERYNGHRIIGAIGAVLPGEWWHAHIGFTESAYVITLLSEYDSDYNRIILPHGRFSRIRYQLFPELGDTRDLKHDCTIYIQWLKNHQP